MSVHTNESDVENDTEYGTIGPDAQDLRRYADLSLETGEIVIYDRSANQAWIQSKAAIDLDDAI